MLRSWSDHMTSPLANKYTWYQGGSLCLAVKHLTGREPEFLLSDVRDPDRTSLVVAEDALRREYRVRLFNRKWIEGMMKEGYAGADQVAVMASNTLGWQIMREKSVSDDIWAEIAEIYVRDKLHLSVRQWFETDNPFAFQELTEVMLESIRKGYWKADPSLAREIAEHYLRSVVQHGEGGGLRGGGNVKLERFVKETLGASASPDMVALLEQYDHRARETTIAMAAPASGNRAPAPEPAALTAAPPANALPAAGSPTSAAIAATASAGADPAPGDAAKAAALRGQKPVLASDSPPTTSKNHDATVENVQGVRMEPSQSAGNARAWAVLAVSGALLVVLVGLGAWRRIGTP